MDYEKQRKEMRTDIAHILAEAQQLRDETWAELERAIKLAFFPMVLTIIMTTAILGYKIYEFINAEPRVVVINTEDYPQPRYTAEMLQEMIDNANVPDRHYSTEELLNTSLKTLMSSDL